MRHVDPCNKHRYICVRYHRVSASHPHSVHVAPRCPAHPPAALSFRNPRDNVKRQRENAWKFSRELSPEAAHSYLRSFTSRFRKSGPRVCETVHASIYLYFSFSSLSLSLLSPLHHFASVICNVHDFNAAVRFHRAEFCSLSGNVRASDNDNRSTSGEFNTHYAMKGVSRCSCE